MRHRCAVLEAIRRFVPPVSSEKEDQTLLRSLIVLVAACGFAVLANAGPAWATPVSAADLLDAKVDYTADYYLTSNNGHFHGTVIHAPGRERRDFDSSGGHQTLVLRRDIDEATILWPERKWYVTTSFASVANLIGGFDGVMLDREAVGHEVVGGEPTTRYQVQGSSGDRGRFQGQMWFTKDDILIKAVGHVVFNGREMAVETGLTHLRRIKADPAAFVRPADYHGIPLDLAKLGIH
jgi:hypothetical protein